MKGSKNCSISGGEKWLFGLCIFIFSAIIIKKDREQAWQSAASIRPNSSFPRRFGKECWGIFIKALQAQAGTVGDPGSELFLLKDIVRSNTSICLFGSHKDAIFLESSSHKDLCSNSGSDTKGVSAAEGTKERQISLMSQALRRGWGNQGHFGLKKEMGEKIRITDHVSRC